MPAYENPFNPTTQIGSAFAHSAKALYGMPTEGELSNAISLGQARLAGAQKSVNEAAVTRMKLEALQDPQLRSQAALIAGTNSGPAFNRVYGSLLLKRINDKEDVSGQVQGFQKAHVGEGIISGERSPEAGAQTVAAMQGKPQFGSGQFGTYSQYNPKLNEAFNRSAQSLAGAREAQARSAAGASGASAEHSRALTEQAQAGTNVPLVPVQVPGDEFNAPRTLYRPRQFAIGGQVPPKEFAPGSEKLTRTFKGYDEKGNPIYETVANAPGVTVTGTPPKKGEDKPPRSANVKQIRDEIDRQLGLTFENNRLTAGVDYDPDVRTAVAARAAEIWQENQNTTAAVQQAINEITPRVEKYTAQSNFIRPNVDRFRFKRDAANAPVPTPRAGARAGRARPGAVYYGPSGTKYTYEEIEASARKRGMSVDQAIMQLKLREGA